MTPLILISNDDGYAAKGLKALISVAREFGDVVVMSTFVDASAKGMSLTTAYPLRARLVEEAPAAEGLHSLRLYACNGTPVDSVKLAVETFCPRRPDLVLSGINHGSNASCNVLYSGTMGAALEAATAGYPAVGFSLLDHHYDADFNPCLPFVRRIVAYVLGEGLPQDVVLNVNIPKLPEGEIRGVRVCRSARACWTNSFECRTDPHHHDYWWLTGNFECDDLAPDTDQWALANGYVSVVPMKPDFTHRETVPLLKSLEQS